MAWESFAIFADVVKDEQLNKHLGKHLPLSQAQLQFITSPPCFLVLASHVLFSITLSPF